MHELPATRPWHEADDWEAAASARGLSERERAQVASFRRDGFLVVEDARVLDELDVDGIWGRLGGAFAADGSGRVQDAWERDAVVRAIATHPSVMATVRLLYGREPIPFQTLNFLTGTEQRTHSDTIHFSSLPSGFMCGVWFALEDVTLRQGPLHYYPGSQRLPECDYDHLGVEPVVGEHSWANPNTLRSYQEYERRIADLARESGFRREELAIPRGAFLVWSANLLHGGSPRDDRTLTRKSQVTHYYFDGSVPFTPMFSRARAGEYAVRRVRDIRSGRWTTPTLDHAPVVFPPRDGGRRAIRRIGGVPGAILTPTMGWHGGLPGSVRDSLALARRELLGPLR